MRIREKVFLFHGSRRLLLIAPLLVSTLVAACDGGGGGEGGGGGGTTSENPKPGSSPILFVTQTPYHSGFDTLTSTFGNHQSSPNNVPRGGDLMILYPDGNLRNLTAEAGFGKDPAKGIAVREPSVSWDGKRALFAMVEGGTAKNDLGPFYWQIYEVTGLGEGEAAHIERVANQPEGWNNVSPIYGTDGRIVFSSDRPRNGDVRLYPQLDEYESVATNTGLWSFDPAVAGGDLRQLTHTPSGAFSPKIALDGRVIYVRWDHLQQDQQAHADRQGTASYGSFDFASEDGDERSTGTVERFPEPMAQDETPAGKHYHIFNQFFPWQINEDGTAEETVNHVGRHEFNGYFDASEEGLPYHGPSESHAVIRNFLHVAEDLHTPGTFYGVDAPEFGTHSSGQIVKFDGRDGLNAADMYPVWVTDPSSADAPEAGAGVAPGAEGHYRDPLPLSDGTLVAVATPDPRQESGQGDGPFGNDTYEFRMRHMVPKAGTPYLTAGEPLTPGIVKTVAYFDNTTFADASYTGRMWELFPVEVVARPKPATRTFEVPEIERKIIDDTLQASGGYEALRAYLAENGLALAISRDVTRRMDEQQPFSLEVPGGVSTIADGMPVQEIDAIQFFQADQVRGYDNHRAGRRPIPREMHDAPDDGGPLQGAYKLGLDGSFAALVPARRAMSWQLTAPDGSAVVRERYWVTFQPGEIRVCPNCHGINETDVVKHEPTPENPPEALAPLLQSLFP